MKPRTRSEPIRLFEKELEILIDYHTEQAQLAGAREKDYHVYRVYEMLRKLRENVLC